MLSYVAKHSKQRKTTKLIKLQWIALIWCQNEQKTINYKRNQITSNLHRFDMKTIYNVELRRKTFKTTQNYESDQITTDCIDLMSKTSNQRKTTKVIILRWNCIDLTSKRSKQCKTTNAIKLRSICIDLTSKHQNDQKCCVSSQNIQKNAKLRKWSNYNELHRFEVKTIKTCELGGKTTKVIKLQWIASIWLQNDPICWVTSHNIQNNA